MDKPRPCGGDKSVGTNKNSSDWDAKKEAIELRVLGAMLIFGVSLSFVVGIVASKVGIVFSIIACLLAGVICTMIGMAVGGVRSRTVTENMRAEMMADQRRDEDKHCREVRNAIDSTRKECSGFVVETSKAVANRVANRLLARYAPMLAEAEHREATLQETDEIVDEEIAALQQAVGDETETQKDS